MVEELDAGPIVEQEILPTEGLTYHQIRARMLSFQAEILARSVEKVLKAGKAPFHNICPKTWSNLESGFRRADSFARKKIKFLTK